MYCLSVPEPRRLDQGVSRATFPPKPDKESFSPLLSFWGFAGSHWPSLACRCTTLILHLHTTFSMCLCLHMEFFFIRISIISTYKHTLFMYLILTYYICNDALLKSGHILMLGVGTLFWVEITIQPITGDCQKY